MKTIAALRSELPDAIGHGGQRRSFQIDELLHAHDVKVNTYLYEAHPLKARDIPRALALFCLEGASIAPSFQTLGRCWRRQRPIADFLLSNSERVLLWEDTTNFVGMFVAKRLGFRVIAVPQNLESLRPAAGRPASIGQATRRLRSEIECLRRCDRVVTISQEEKWFLAQFGIRAEFIPYLPPAIVESEMTAVRAARSCNNESGFLILGTAGNPPTFDGMKKIIQVLGGLDLPDDLVFHVGGFGTETMELPNNKRFVSHGSLSSSELHRLLENVRAAIIYQEYGTGALTRISELACAGVPMIANRIAARSTEVYGISKGLYVFETVQELRTLLLQSSYREPDAVGFTKLQERSSAMLFKACFPKALAGRLQSPACTS